jgi:hypothetical protein
MDQPAPNPVSVPPTAPTAQPLRRARVQRAPEKRSVAFWISIALAAVLGVALVVSLHYLFEPKKTGILLQAEFADSFRLDETATKTAIRAPRNWQIDDRRPFEVNITGPREPGFAPVLQIYTLPAAGKLPAYVEEHKARLKYENPSLEFLGQEDDALDGCPAIRLEYECDYQVDPKLDAKTPSVRIHALQYILRAPGYPMYYKVSCWATKESFEKYRPYFEASIHTLRRFEQVFEVLN